MRIKPRNSADIMPRSGEERRFPAIEPLPRCRCGACQDCRENDRWERIFARFEVKQYWEERGLLQSSLGGL